MSTILVVEDNPANLKLITAVLEHGGHRILQAGDAGTGLREARRHRPDLILMDIQLPGMDGLDATRLLKADDETAGIPVVALTAFAMKGDELRVKNAGCDAYITKPFDYKTLLARIQAILHQRPGNPP